MSASWSSSCDVVVVGGCGHVGLPLAIAMAALGLTTHVQAVRAAGFKPLLLAAVLFAWLLLAGLAYTLMTRLRATALHGTELAACSAATIRVRLLKIGAQVWRNTRRIRLALASHHPLRDVYLLAAHRLAASP